MATTHRPERSDGETHRGSLLLVHVAVSLALWWLILVLARALLA